MIVGVTGTIGSGKGTVVDYLVHQKGFKLYSVSDGFLASEARRRRLEPDRITRRNIANELRAISPTKLMESVLAEARDDIKAGVDIVADPQHTVAEVKYIQAQGGIVFGVDADLEIRYERIKKRGSAKDNVTYEEFARHHAEEMKSDDANKNNLLDSIEAADYGIQNNGTVEELYAQIDAVLAKLK